MSVALKWFLAEEDKPQAMALLREANELSCTLRAPDFLVVEAANVVWKRHRRGEVTVEKAAEIIERIAFARLEWTAAVELVPRAAALAMEFDCTVYDSLYLALAEAYEATLITADRRLCERVPAAWQAERIQLLHDFSA
ncbi:MAG TPA: type II toxin-antitoxin system VapC family toxin [Armatimonadota bacterium]